MAKIRLKISEERLNTKITIGDMADAEEGSITAMIKVLVPFVIGSGDGYLSPKVAEEKLRALNFNELAEVTEAYRAGVAEATDTTPKADS